MCSGRVTNSPASDADGDSIGAALFSRTRIWNLAVRNGHTDELGGQLVSTEKSTIDHTDGKAPLTPHPPTPPHPSPLGPHLGRGWGEKTRKKDTRHTARGRRQRH